MHRISYVQIKNFRACKDVEIHLDAFTPLVGPNNAGKSTILEALAWVLRPTGVPHSDYHDPKEPIEVVAQIDGIDDELLGQIPNDRHRKATKPYCVDGRLRIRAVTDPEKASTTSVDRQVWRPADFEHNGEPAQWVPPPTGLFQVVQSILPQPLHVRAMHDLDEDLGKVKAGTTIKGLLAELIAPVVEQHEELASALDTIKNLLTLEGSNRSPHLAEFDEAATRALKEFFPGLSVQMDLSVFQPTDLFKAGDIQITDVTGAQRRFSSMGSGAQRAIQMSLIRHLADRSRPEIDRVACRLLLIDEPELYLHPRAVVRLRDALRRLSGSRFQVVFSTHSPIMLDRTAAASTVVVSRGPDGASCVRKPLHKEVEMTLQDAEAQALILFELGNLAEIYFADVVAIVEGETDMRLLKVVEERTAADQPHRPHIAFVQLRGSGNITNALRILKAMKIPTCAVADLDFAYKAARKTRLLDPSAPDLEAMRPVVSRLSVSHGFPLGGDSLPKNQKNGEWSAEKAWAVVAQDPEGAELVASVRSELLQHDVWIWAQGCVEDVTGAKSKGEDSIAEQEERLVSMSAEELQQSIPSFVECVNWVRAYGARA